MKTLAFVRVCLFSLLIVLPIFAQSEDEIACREIVKTFYVAYQAKDATKLSQFWKSDSKYLNDFQTETNKFFTENQGIAVKDLKFGRTYFKDEVFRLRIEVTINDKTQNLTFQFVKENNQWKIWKISSTEGDFIEILAFAENDYERDLTVSQNVSFEYANWRDLAIKQGQILEKNGQTLKSNQFFFWIKQQAEVNKDKFGVSHSWLNIGISNLGRLELDLAQQALDQSIKLCSENEDKYCVARSYTILGLVYAIQDNEVLAETYYNKGLKVAYEIGDKKRVAVIKNNLGTLKSSFNKLTDSIVYFNDVLTLYKEINDERGIAIALGNIAGELMKEGKYVEALNHFEIVEKTFSKLGENGFLIITFKQKAQAEISLGQFEKALETIKKGLKISSETDFSNDEDFNSFAIKGQALRFLKRYDEAEKVLLDAISKIERFRNSFVNEEKNLGSFYKKRILAYHETIALFEELGEIKKSLFYSETIKSRVLYDVMRTGKSNLSKAMSASELEQQVKLKQAINEANRQLTREQQKDYQNKTRIIELENNLKQSRFALEEFQLKLYATKPELKIQRGEFQPINLDQIAKLFPDEKTAILEFAVTNERSFLYAITKENGKLNLQIYPIDLNKSDLAKKTESFRQNLQNKNLDYQIDARELYKLLLGKAETQLKGKDSLIIVPDSFLWEVPFQALMSKKDRFLIEDSAINYVPSLTVLREMNKSSGLLSNSPKLLAFGNPELNTNNKEKVEKQVRGGKLESLKEAEKEVDYLGKLYGFGNSKILKNSNATETFFKTEASKFNILHFATHGILNNQNPMYSSLVLSLANDTKEDGLLEAWELMDMNIKADLAVLSACETGRGEASSGEGIVGLSWAFFIAGTPRIVATQWKVESESTSEIMQNFHKNLRKSSNVSKSLQKSMLAQLKNPITRHPFYWAGFISIGKN
jgi:CHAT domain-containing protein